MRCSDHVLLLPFASERVVRRELENFMIDVGTNTTGSAYTVDVGLPGAE